jgi:transcriptional regulator with XRE-family HTH domain
MGIDDGLAHRVLRRRIERGLTQQELAEIAGISVRTLREIERGRVTHPHTRAMAGLRQALGATAMDPHPPTIRPGADPRIHVGILGPLQVRRDNALVAITSTMLRRMLALVSLQPGVLLSRDEMVDALWSGRPPSAYKSALHGYVSRLQAALADPETGPPMLRSDRTGYLLVAEPSQLDVA